MTLIAVGFSECEAVSTIRNELRVVSLMPVYNYFLRIHVDLNAKRKEFIYSYNY